MNKELAFVLDGTLEIQTGVCLSSHSVVYPIVISFDPNIKQSKLEIAQQIASEISDAWRKLRDDLCESAEKSDRSVVLSVRWVSRCVTQINF